MRKPILLFFVLVQTCFSQNTDREKRTYFENITIDPEGHVCYTEALGDNPMNRLEFRINGKRVLNVFQVLESSQTKIEVSDFDSDGKADLIYVERDYREKTIEKVSLYRGKEYQEHLKRHLMHALRTASHPLIKDRPDEQMRARQVQSSLQELEKHSIQQSEMGFYSAERLFEPSNHKDISYAFTASDTLIQALRLVIEGDYKMLSQQPEIVTRYQLEIKILMNIDPAASGSRSR